MHCSVICEPHGSHRNALVLHIAEPIASDKPLTSASMPQVSPYWQMIETFDGLRLATDEGRRGYNSQAALIDYRDKRTWFSHDHMLGKLNCYVYAARTHGPPGEFHQATLHFVSHFIFSILSSKTV